MRTYRFDLGKMHIWHRHATDEEALEAARQIAASQGHKIVVHLVGRDDGEADKGVVGVAEAG